MLDISVRKDITGRVTHSVRFDRDTSVAIMVEVDGTRKVGVNHDPTHGKHGSKPPTMYEIGQEPSEYSETVQHILSTI